MALVWHGAIDDGRGQRIALATLLVLAAVIAGALNLYHRAQVNRPANQASTASSAEITAAILAGPKSECAQQHKVLQPGVKQVSAKQFELTYKCVTPPGR